MLEWPMNKRIDLKVTHPLIELSIAGIFQKPIHSMLSTFIGLRGERQDSVITDDRFCGIIQYSNGRSTLLQVNHQYHATPGDVARKIKLRFKVVYSR